MWWRSNSTAGGEIRPALSRLEGNLKSLASNIHELRSLAMDAKLNAEQAKLVAVDVQEEARELGVRVHEANEVATVQRGVLDQSITAHADRMSREITDSTRAFAKLLHEHGGPDLTDHIPAHTHSVSEPLMTEPPESSEPS